MLNIFMVLYDIYIFVIYLLIDFFPISATITKAKDSMSCVPI